MEMVELLNNFVFNTSSIGLPLACQTMQWSVLVCETSKARHTKILAHR